MHRVDNSTAVAALPASTANGPNPDGFYGPGDPGQGIPATIVDAEHLNMMQEEISQAIEAAGLVLDKADNTQLSQAIPLIAGAVLLVQNNLWLKAQRGDSEVLVYGASQDIDISTAQHFELTLAGNPVINNPTNLVAGQEGTITFIQDAIGSRAPSGWGSYWSFEDSAVPYLTATPTKKDTFAYFVRAADEIVLKPAVRNY